ncbi:MAG: response regulator [Crocinitomicaceae bacterium]
MRDNQIVNLLLVEDRAEDAELALMALEKHKLINQIKWVKDGQEALDFLFCQNEYANREKKNQPKLILLDLKMPKVSGLEVLHAVKANPKTKNIPIVALTTSREDQDRVEAYNLGVNSYIVKPVDFDNFTKCVQELGFYWLLLNEPPY